MKQLKNKQPTLSRIIILRESGTQGLTVLIESVILQIEQENIKVHLPRKLQLNHIAPWGQASSAGILERRYDL